MQSAPLGSPPNSVGTPFFLFGSFGYAAARFASVIPSIQNPKDRAFCQSPIDDCRLCSTEPILSLYYVSLPIAKLIKLGPAELPVTSS